MTPRTAWLLLLAAVGLTWLALAGPWPIVAALAAAAWLGVAKGRKGLTVFAVSTLVVNSLLLGWLSPGPEVLWGPFGTAGVKLGLIGAARVIAIVAANQVLLTRWSLTAWIDGLRLPRRPTAFLAAVLLASRDVGHDFARLRDARRLDGQWPETRTGRVRAAAALLPALLVAAWRRAGIRREALRLVGIAVGPRFAPVVAVTALAVAGRLAFIAVPNVALTYVIVFCGGIAFGPRVGFLAGLYAMALTDLILSGFAPAVYVNAPAMGLIGALGGAMARLADSNTRAAWMASAGILGTLWFSLLTDLATWALVPEFRTSWDLLRLRLLAGLAFNAVPALTNAVLFAWAAAPVSRAFAALRGGQQENRRPERHAGLLAGP